MKSLLIALSCLLLAFQPVYAVRNDVNYTAVTANTTAQTVTLSSPGTGMDEVRLSVCNDDAAGGDPIFFDTTGAAFVVETAPAAAAAALAGAGAGNVDNGAHSYKVVLDAPTNSNPGNSVSVTVADKTADGKVALTSIPVGTTGVTTQRLIYRTEAGGSTYYLLATIADNTTTTYTDNIADATLITQGAYPTVVDFTSVKVLPQECFSQNMPQPITLSVISASGTAVVRFAMRDVRDEGAN